MDSENRNKKSVLINNNNGSSSKMKETDHNLEGTEIVKAIVAVAGLGLAAWLISKLFGSSDGNGKTMKAPGRDYRIFRDDFESDPADYFRNLRNDYVSKFVDLSPV